MNRIQNVVFLGSKPLGLQVLDAIHRLRPEALLSVVTFDDSADDRSALDGFKTFAEATGKTVSIAKDASDAERIIRSLQPDLVLVVCWYWLLKDALLSAIPHGAIGIHNSLLPNYRGGSPLVWAILNGEKEIGYSVFSLASEMDAGQIWLQERIELPADANVGHALELIRASLLATLESSWCALLDGELKPRPQSEDGVSYCAQRMPVDGRIDWSRSAKQVADFIRAQSPPYPGAFSVYDGKHLVIPAAAIWHSTYYGVPGQVCRVGSDHVLVVCGDNRALVLTTVIVDGTERPARQVLSSIKIRL